MMLQNPPTLFPDLNAVLDQLVSGTQAILGANLIGVYLQGSFAVGDADQHSDVDFLVVVHQPLSAAEVLALQELHGRIYDQPCNWAKHLEGSYFPGDLLRWGDPAHTKLWFLDNTSRVLEPSDHDNSLVVRWQAREHGIALVGPDLKTLIDPIPPENLHCEVRAVMQDWGAEIISGRYSIDNRWAQPFAVISYCRMLQTLETGTIQSKLAAVRWGLEHLDPRWTDLIQRAWADRPDPSTKFRTPAEPEDVRQTIEFIYYALELIG
jgi:hypothetical protein